MIASPTRRRADEDPVVDPDDFWQAQSSLPAGTVSFTEYDEPGAAEPRKDPRPRRDRVRFGFQPNSTAYED